MADRIAAIQKMLEKSPQDVFLHYSLGMEFYSAGQFGQACAEFQRCIDLERTYLPAYVEAGKALRSAGHLPAAREMFARGLELARQKGDAHMQDHIQQQLEGLA